MLAVAGEREYNVSQKEGNPMANTSFFTKMINIKKEMFHEHTHKENNTISHVSGNRYHPAVFYRTGTSDWKYVASNAFSGIFMWNDLRSTVWFGNRFYSADFSIFSIRHADDVSDGCCNGF